MLFDTHSALFRNEMPMIAAPVLPVFLMGDANEASPATKLTVPARAFLGATGFKPGLGRLALLPDEKGALAGVVLGIGADEGLAENPFLLAKLAQELPSGTYRIEGTLARPDLALLGFHLGQYRFERFKRSNRPQVQLEAPDGVDAAKAQRIAAAICAGRDLINRPANDLTTTELANAAKALAARYGAKAEEIIGDALKAGFPLIHAVGQASPHPPRLIDMTWGDPSHRKVTLVGKGVVFDTGGLNLKPDASMLLMKKDMGGAASALSAAEIIMGAGLPVFLRVLLPIVENAVSGAAFRPGDIYLSRAGISVEIGNTDAEGRLILAEALSYADEAAPDLLIDFATLTGAARVALGPDLPPFFTDSEPLSQMIEAAGRAVHDPVWRLPLWKPYRAMLDSKTADMNNVSSGGFAGAITAALFLKQFVTKTHHYAHFDIYGWVPVAKPGRPEGGEPQAARLVALLAEECDRLK